MTRSNPSVLAIVSAPAPRHRDAVVAMVLLRETTTTTLTTVVGLLAATAHVAMTTAAAHRLRAIITTPVTGTVAPHLDGVALLLKMATVLHAALATPTTHRTMLAALPHLDVLAMSRIHT